MLAVALAASTHSAVTEIFLSYLWAELSGMVPVLVPPSVPEAIQHFRSATLTMSLTEEMVTVSPVLASASLSRA